MTQLVPYNPAAGSIAVFNDADPAGLLHAAFVDVGIRTFQLQRLEMPSGGGIAFTVPTLTGEEPVASIDGVIVMLKGNEKSWWAASYAASGGGSPPDCQSHDGVRGYGIRTLTPELNEQPSWADCKGCPWNQFGSKRSDTPGVEPKGKDCKDQTYIYFFAGEARLPWLCIAPPTSLKVVQEYAIKLMNHGHKPESVVTRFSLERSATVPAYSKLKLAVVSVLAPAERERLQPMIELVRTHLRTFDPYATERTVSAEPAAAEAAAQPATPPAGDNDSAGVAAGVAAAMAGADQSTEAGTSSGELDSDAAEHWES